MIQSRFLSSLLSMASFRPPRRAEHEMGVEIQDAPFFLHRIHFFNNDVLLFIKMKHARKRFAAPARQISSRGNNKRLFFSFPLDDVLKNLFSNTPPMKINQV